MLSLNGRKCYFLSAWWTISATVGYFPSAWGRKKCTCYAIRC